MVDCVAMTISLHQLKIKTSLTLLGSQMLLKG